MIFQADVSSKKRTYEFNFTTMRLVFVCLLKNINYKASIIGVLITLALKNINYRASIIGVLIMLALKNTKYKASIISILIVLTLKNIKYKASIISILIMLALKNINYKHSEPEWNISNKNCLAWNIAQTYDFCIPLDLLDTKDLKKTFKGQKKFWRPNPKSKTQNFKIL